TFLCAVMYANNEVGTIQPIAEIAGICQSSGVPLHVDAVQAAGILPMNLLALGVSSFSISGHKLGAPKGIGALVTNGK
ncbi:aminotransferase class V-fold PLP-dependent enzyme, partial [Staphylococcus aureus]|nr:aminotransferase class V-fold PLP-dependent enzyme [Staphylococcus aureus]